MGTSYADPSVDLVRHGAPASALAPLTPDQKTAACEEASREVDARVGGRYGVDALPFVTWDTTITGITARIATYRLLSVRGFNPAAAQDQLVVKNYDDAIKDCEKIQKQQLHPSVTLRAVSRGADQPKVISSSVVDARGRTASNRGW